MRATFIQRCRWQTVISGGTLRHPANSTSRFLNGWRGSVDRNVQCSSPCPGATSRIRNRALAPPRVISGCMVPPFATASRRRMVMEHDRSLRDSSRCQRAFDAAATSVADHHYPSDKRPCADVTQLRLPYLDAHPSTFLIQVPDRREWNLCCLVWRQPCLRPISIPACGAVSEASRSKSRAPDPHPSQLEHARRRMPISPHGGTTSACPN